MAQVRLRLIAVLVLAALAAWTEAARADGLRFSLEYDYNLTDTETRSAGEVRSSDSDSLTQRYRLDFDRRLYPALTLRGGGLFERSDFAVESAGTSIDSRLIRTSPYFDLLLGTPLYSAGVGIRRLEDRTESSLLEESTLIRNIYNANFNWRPQELPSLNLQYTLTESFDRQRLLQDGETQRFLFGSIYQPVETVRLGYQGSFTRTDDDLIRLRTDEQSHAGRLDYADRFRDGRVSVNGSYGLSHRRTETVSAGVGEVATVQPVFGGLFTLSDTPETAELEARSTLADGNLQSSAGIDLLFSPVGGDSARRQLGLEIDLLDPATQVSGLRVWVDRDVPPTVAGLFQWEVFTSSDNFLWTPVVPVGAVVFGIFPDGFRFDIRLPAPQRSRFIKVVAAPLAATDPRAVQSNIPNIFVTELQAVRIQTAAEAARKTGQTSQQLSLAARTLLLSAPTLYYDFSLFYTTTEPAAVSRLFVANGLSLLHRFTPKLSATAQGAREDTDEPRGKREGYRYGFSLLATPLPSLSHTLTFSGRREDAPEGFSRRHSLFLNNRAALYRGVDLLLNGGASLGRQPTGEDVESLLLNAGLAVTPHRSMTWNFSLSADRSERRGGGRPPSVSTSRRAGASLSYNPLAALNLFVSLDAVDQQGEATRTLQNYAVNWSPFREGALQLNVSYNEVLRPEDDAVDRLIVPSVSWEIRRGTFLTVSQAWIDSKTALQKTETRSFNATLRANF